MMNAVESNEDFYSTANIIIISFAYVINFACCLVYNEVIILNFWNLDYNTKKRIEKRMDIENNAHSIEEKSISSLEEGSLRGLGANSMDDENSGNNDDD